MIVILALDIGSSSVRCSAYDCQKTGTDGINVESIPDASTVIRMTSVQPNTGKIQLFFDDNSKSLLDLIDFCVDSTLAKVRSTTKSFQVMAVGVSSFVMNLLAIDKDGNLVGEKATISYACNTTDVANECLALKQELGPTKSQDLYQKTGAPIHSSYALPQLRVLYEDSELMANLDKWQTIASLCMARWVGKTSLPISHSEASWTGLLNFRTCNYEESALELLPNINALPELADATSVISVGVSPSSKYWKNWPELQQTSFFLGIGDGACANVGSKAVTSSRIAVTIGTSAAARICLPMPSSSPSSSNFRVPSGLFCYRIDEDHILVGGALTDGGSIMEWARNLLNLSSDEAFLDCMNDVEQLINQDQPSTHGPIMIPFLSGERSTGYRAGATGSIQGLTRATTPAHFIKACLEGVTLRLKAVLERIIESRSGNSCPPTIMVSGKALESNLLWRQMIADCTGLQVVLDSGTTEGTSRGVARLVGLASMTRNNSEGETNKLLVEEIIQEKALVSDPRPNAKAYFDGLSLSQEDLISALTPFYTGSG